MEKPLSSKYKTRLIIMIVIIVCSALMGTIIGKAAYKQLQPVYVAINESIETLEVTSDEDYEEVLRKNHPELMENTDLKNRTETIEAFKALRDAYDSSVFKYGEGGLCAGLYLFFSGIAVGTMLLVIIVRKIMNRFWKDLKTWILVLIPTLFVLLLFGIQPILYVYVFGMVGIIGQLPFLIYNFVKYKKAKKAEDKDDIIVKKEETKDVEKETKEEE